MLTSVKSFYQVFQAEGDRSIVDLAEINNLLSSFNATISAAGLGEILEKPGPYIAAQECE